MAVFQYDSASLGRSVKIKRRLLLLAVLASAVLVVAFGAVLAKSLVEKNRLAGLGVLSKKQVQKAWVKADYQLVFDSCKAALESRPLDSFYLTFYGFSAFYIGVSQVSDEEKVAYIDQCVSALRKALVKAKPPMKKEIHYVLGKAYFHRGAFFLDQAAKYLESALSERMRAEDIDEYLALTYYGLGDNAKSVEHFENALRVKPTDQLYIAMSAALLKDGKAADAAALLQKAIEITKDIAAEQKARFALCDIYIQSGAYGDAESQIALVLEKDAESAEAHYQMGLIHQKKGDIARARAEWRKAVAIDPMHQASRLKLSEKNKPPEANS